MDQQVQSKNQVGMVVVPHEDKLPIRPVEKSLRIWAITNTRPRTIRHAVPMEDGSVVLNFEGVIGHYPADAFKLV